MRNKFDVHASIGLIIKSAGKSLEKALDTELRNKFGLSGGQWKVIGALAIKNGLTQKEIADLVFVEGATLVPIIDRMEKNGFVKRMADRDDRRSNKIFLTKKSETLTSKIIKSVLDVRKIATSDITLDDIETTKKTLLKITENADSFIEQRSNRLTISASTSRRKKS